MDARLADRDHRPVAKRQSRQYRDQQLDAQRSAEYRSPNIYAPIRIIGLVDQWFDPALFAAVPRFGTLGRNVVIGPAFHNTDLSVSKVVTIASRYRLQLRVDALSIRSTIRTSVRPATSLGSPTFGKIWRTRLPTGEAGSSRQIQLAAKLSF